jgi:membrane-associated phospholipid phosphatase
MGGVMSVRRPSVSYVLVMVAIAAITVFAALTIAVTGGSSLSLDSRAFEVARDLRAPWLDSAARVVTSLGLMAIVGPVFVLGALLLIRHRERVRAVVLMIGGALAWIGVWILKSVVARPRPPGPLVHTTGQSYPSGHAANSVGWLALAIALTVLVPSRSGRIATIAAGTLIALLVGLSRIYLRAHYFSDVLAGEALAVAFYALAAIGAVAWQSRRDPGSDGKRRRSDRPCHVTSGSDSSLQVDITAAPWQERS